MFLVQFNVSISSAYYSSTMEIMISAAVFSWLRWKAWFGSFKDAAMKWEEVRALLSTILVYRICWIPLSFMLLL